MRRLLLFVLGVITGFAVSARAEGPIQVNGAWHCGDDGCVWSQVRDMKNFDAKNHWLIDRGDGEPAVNLVILSFVDPMRLLNKTNDEQTIDGVPTGMNPAVVEYFTSHKVRVMISIG